MKPGRVFLGLFSVLCSLFLIEILLRFLNYPPELNKKFQRKDILWTIENVSLNSYGYRDKEVNLQKADNTFRIYLLGDSYTYGWLVDNPEDRFANIVERNLSEQLKIPVELINAASPGFTLKEMVGRFANEGRYFNPDLVLIGLNDDEANISRTYLRKKEIKFLSDSYLFQATVGNFLDKNVAKKNHEYLAGIYRNQDSKDWPEFTALMLKLKQEASKINAGLGIVLFPHIHANNPNAPYDLYEFNQKIKDFATKNKIYLVDPVETFLKYPDKTELRMNPLDPHPTVKMNKLLAEEILKQFDFQTYFQHHLPYIPNIKINYLSAHNLSLGKFNRIDKVSSNTGGLPWVYFETKNETNTQTFPLIGSEFRQMRYNADYLQTAKSFTHSGLPGATMIYNLYPDQKGVIKIKENLYGYRIVGINYLMALQITPNGATRSDYLLPTSIKREGGEWIFSFNQNEDYQMYKANLKVAVKQIDISPDGKAENLMQTIELKTRTPTETDKVSLPLAQKIYSWSKFEDFANHGFEYALVSGKVEPLVKVETNRNQLTLTFSHSIKSGQEVVFYASAKYLLAPKEILKVETE